MATDVKRRPPGQARTRLARAAVIEAARTLFLERGYPATTIGTISDLADVPPATVYRLFSSKSGILKALLDVSIAGDDQAVAVQDRPHVCALLADPDPQNRLSGFAGITCGIMARTEPVYRILVSAAASDRDAAALLAEQTRYRQQGQAQIARSLARSGLLRPGMRERDAADIIHALMSPEVYRLLVGDRGWTPQRYQQWLTATLVDQLLPSPASGGEPAGHHSDTLDQPAPARKLGRARNGHRQAAATWPLDRLPCRRLQKMHAGSG
jgi:AcrR family transcriptional regulator